MRYNCEVCIDGESLDTVAAVENLCLAFSLAHTTDVGVKTHSVAYEFSLPATSRNISFLGGYDSVFDVQRFNTQEHSVRIAWNGEVLLEGQVVLIQTATHSDGSFYRFRLIPSDDAWLRVLDEKLMHDLPLNYQQTFSADTIQASWTADYPDPVRFFPVIRDRFDAVYDVESATPIRVLTPDNYHPFIRLETLFNLIIASTGYRIESQFLSSEFFRSLYVSGAYRTLNTELLRKRMAFYAGRSADTDWLQVAADQMIFANPSRTTGLSVGNIVDTANCHENPEFFNHGGCLQRLNDKVVFVPSQQVVVGFEYLFRYESTFRVISVDRLETLAGIWLDDDLKYTVTVPNHLPVLNRSTHFKGALTLVCRREAGRNYRLKIVYEESSRGVQYMNVTSDTTSTLQSYYIQEVQFEGTDSEGVYRDISAEWSLYADSVLGGTVQVQVTLRSQMRQRSAGAPVYFDAVRFQAPSSAIRFRLLASTRLRPVFSTAPALGSSLVDADLLAWDACTQRRFVESVSQLFNLRFGADPSSQTLYVEPNDRFFTDEITDWRALQAPEAGVEIEEYTGGFARTMTYQYADGDGAVARWNEDNKKKFGRWRVSVDDHQAESGEHVVENPLFTPTLSTRSFLPTAQSAAIIQTGDRLRYNQTNEGELQMAPKIVRWLGVRPLLTGERWGWPATYSHYPLAAFHLRGNLTAPAGYDDTVASAEEVEQYGFTLCFEDRDGNAGLNRYYRRMFESATSARTVTVSLRLTPQDFAQACRATSGGYRGRFRITVCGEPVVCRLLEINDYNPGSDAPVRCKFLKTLN